MTVKKEYTCVVCPNGCPLQVATTDGDKPELIAVSGNLCPRGAKWAKQEIENPMRTISTNVLLEGGAAPVVSVRTLDPIPLKDIMAVRESLKGLSLKAPVHVGDIIATEPAGVPCRIAVTRNAAAKAK